MLLSAAYSSKAVWICRKFETHLVMRTGYRIFEKTGSKTAARSPIMAMTTRDSTSVSPRLPGKDGSEGKTGVMRGLGFKGEKSIEVGATEFLGVNTKVVKEFRTSNGNRLITINC